MFFAFLQTATPDVKRQPTRAIFGERRINTPTPRYRSNTSSRTVPTRLFHDPAPENDCPAACALDFGTPKFDLSERIEMLLEEQETERGIISHSYMTEMQNFSRFFISERQLLEDWRFEADVINSMFYESLAAVYRNFLRTFLYIYSASVLTVEDRERLYTSDGISLARDNTMREFKRRADDERRFLGKTGVFERVSPPGQLLRFLPIKLDIQNGSIVISRQGQKFITYLTGRVFLDVKHTDHNFAFVCSLYIGQKEVFFTSKSLFSQFRMAVHNANRAVGFSTDIIPPRQSRSLFYTTSDINFFLKTLKASVLREATYEGQNSKDALYLGEKDGRSCVIKVFNTNAFNAKEIAAHSIAAARQGSFCASGEFCTDGLKSAIVMPKYPQDLQQLLEEKYIKKDIAVSEEMVIRFMKQILQGYNFLHQQGIVHRDGKLENVYCIDEENVVVADFGFATTPQEGMRGLTLKCGTPYYLAPDMLRDGPTTYQVDNYTIGVIMFILMHFHFPHKDNIPNTWAALHARETFNVYDHMPRRTYHPLLRRLCGQLLDPNPETRMEIPDALSILDSI
ncbi:MAG: protein kinase [Alphaproteobacteria bacterium]|nr:MAG: protein kinase [Alphaproteobacteria bacterium]